MSQTLNKKIGFNNGMLYPFKVKRTQRLVAIIAMLIGIFLFLLPVLFAKLSYSYFGLFGFLFVAIGFIYLQEII